MEQSEAVGRALKRLLSLLYDTVHLVSSPQHAVDLLQKTQGIVDVVCGQDYDREGSCLDWVSKWQQQGTVGHVVLTTFEPVAQLPAGVDAIFSKPLDLRALMQFLRAPVHHAA